MIILPKVHMHLQLTVLDRLRKAQISKQSHQSSHLETGTEYLPVQCRSQKHGNDWGRNQDVPSNNTSQYFMYKRRNSLNTFTMSIAVEDKSQPYTYKLEFLTLRIKV